QHDLEGNVQQQGEVIGRTVLALYQSFDAVVLDRVRAVAQRLIAEGAKPYELAGRFVSIPQSDGRIEWEPQVYLEWFATIVPPEQWDAGEIPEFGPQEVSDTDTSLDNRIKLAANAMRAKRTTT